MALNCFLYNYSEEYVASVDTQFLGEITSGLSGHPRCEMQSTLNREIFKRLLRRGWAYDSLPAGTKAEMDRSEQLSQIGFHNNRELCRTTCNLKANWHCDFAKEFSGKLVQVEAQFGKVESMFKDFVVFKSPITSDGWAWARNRHE